MLLGIQILGVLFALFMLYITFLSFKRKEFKIGELLFWVIAWGLFIWVTISPNSLKFFVDALSMHRPLDLLIVTGFLFLIFLSFYNHLSIKKSSRKLEILVSKLAIKRAEKKNED